MFRRGKWYFLRFCFISMVLDNFSPLTTSWCCQVYRDCCCKSDYLAQRKTWNCEDIKMFVLSKTLPPPPSQARQNIDFKYLFYQIIWLLTFQTGTVHQPSVNIASSWNIKHKRPLNSFWVRSFITKYDRRQTPTFNFWLTSPATRTRTQHRIANTKDPLTLN